MTMLALLALFGAAAQPDGHIQNPMPPSPIPLSNPATWLTASNFPTMAGGKIGAARIGYVLTINADGIPIKCEITLSTRSAELDRIACSLLRARARFRPLVDEHGNRLIGGYRATLTWRRPTGTNIVRMPASVQPVPPPPRITLSRAMSVIGDPRTWIGVADYPPEAKAQGLGGRVTISLRVGASGVPISCTVLHSSGHSILDETTCSLVMARARFRPALNPDGQPIESQLKQGFSWDSD
jgi:TonB family protein